MQYEQGMFFLYHKTTEIDLPLALLPDRRVMVKSAAEVSDLRTNHLYFCFSIKMKDFDTLL